MLIREFKKEDWNSVKSIYQEGIDTGDATFATSVPSWEEWNKHNLVLLFTNPVDLEKLVLERN